MYDYDRITFRCSNILQLSELTSLEVGNQPTGVFLSFWLLTGRLQVRILFEEQLIGKPIFERLHQVQEKQETSFFIATHELNTPCNANSQRTTSQGYLHWAGKLFDAVIVNFLISL
jgi:hypothetical protein